MKNLAAHSGQLIVFLTLPALVVLSACGSRTAYNIETVTLQHAEVWSKGNVQLIPTLYTEGYVGHFPGGRTVSGPRGIQGSVENLRSAFPDWTETVEQIVVDGDRVVTVYRSTGTHSGQFLGNPASGQAVEILEASVFRMVNGRIAEQWAFPDVLSLQNQTTTGPGQPVARAPDSPDEPAEAIRGAPVAGTLTPEGTPGEPPARSDVGESCVIDLKQSYRMSGGLSGAVEVDFRILVAAPCGSPPGTFDEEWIAYGEFTGIVNGTAATASFSYDAQVTAGGDVAGKIVFGQGLVGELSVRGNFGDGSLSYDGWVDQE